LKRDTTTNEHGVVVATDKASPIVAVSMGDSKFTPGLQTDASTNPINAETGDPVETWGPTDIARVLVGTGGLAKGDPITAETGGKAVKAGTTTAALNYIAGYSAEVRSPGDYVLFQFLPQQVTV
jgi:hypothetical protein